MMTMPATKAKQPVDVSYKVIIIGESTIGKSSLLKKASLGQFSYDTVSTVGIDFVSLFFLVEGVNVKLQIWDTAGQERFRTMTKANFRNAKGIILTFDLTCQETFDTMEYWLKTLVEMQLGSEVVYLVGNKADALTQREVSFQQANKFAERNLMKYFETSAKTGQNVDEMFRSLAYDLLEWNNIEKLNNQNMANNTSFVYVYTLPTEIVIKDMSQDSDKTFNRRHALPFFRKGKQKKSPGIVVARQNNPVVSVLNTTSAKNSSKIGGNPSSSLNKILPTIKLNSKSLTRRDNDFNCCKIS